MTWGAGSIHFTIEKHDGLRAFLQHVISFCDSKAEAEDLLLQMQVFLLEGGGGGVPKSSSSTSRSPAKRKRRALDMLEVAERIFIYTDIMRSSVCSDFKGRCLRIIAYNPNLNQLALNPIFYYPVEQKCIETVLVEIKNEYNEYLPLARSSMPLVVVIHFQRLAS